MENEDRSTEFLSLLTRHDRALFLYVHGLIQSHADADDVLQQTKMVMWKHFGQFESGTNFLAWARKIAFYQILGYRRQCQRGHLAMSEEMLEAVGQEVERLSDEADARREALAACLRKLPTDQRRMMLMRYFEDLEVDQIAGRIDKTTGAVYRALSRVRSTLLTCVEQRMNRSSASPS